MLTEPTNEPTYLYNDRATNSKTIHFHLDNMIRGLILELQDTKMNNYNNFTQQRLFFWPRITTVIAFLEQTYLSSQRQRLG